MKPRIFISSTCYDLKFVREDLADFVRDYDYEPILSENGDIGYTPGQNLDTSCYVAMQTSDMVILIVGSEYGSAASGEVKDKFAEYISITRKEFRTAIDSGIPVFAMIDKKVMAEYGIYELNLEKIEQKELEIQFKVVKDLNVFRFIKEIKGAVNIPIQEFEKSSDIKEFIRKQWADMFKNYLASLRDEKENKKIETSVNEMKNLIQKMNIMLDSVGKNVLAKEDPEEYDEVISQQIVISFCNTLAETYEMYVLDKIKSIDQRKKFIIKLLDCLMDLEGKFEKITDITDDVINALAEYDIIELKADLSSDLGNKLNILHSDRNRARIIEIMSKDDYFCRMVRMIK